jgi:hypothetical protein
MMTHFLNWSQQSVPSELILDDSAYSEAVSIPNLSSGPFPPGIKLLERRYRLRKQQKLAIPAWPQPATRIVMTRAEEMFHDSWGYRFCSPANTIDSFDPFNTLV